MADMYHGGKPSWWDDSTRSSASAPPHVSTKPRSHGVRLPLAPPLARPGPLAFGGEGFALRADGDDAPGSGCSASISAPGRGKERRTREHHESAARAKRERVVQG